MEKVFKTFYVSQRKRPVVHFDLLKGANFEGFSLHFGLNSPSVRPSSSWSLDVFATVMIEFCYLTLPHDITLTLFYLNCEVCLIWGSDTFGSIILLRVLSPFWAKFSVCSFIYFLELSYTRVCLHKEPSYHFSSSSICLFVCLIILREYLRIFFQNSH